MKMLELRQRRREILSIFERNGGRNVRIFGSLARGDSDKDGDVDFLIELEPTRSLLDIVAMKQDLEDILQKDVDVVTESGILNSFRDIDPPSPTLF